jgi:hypothetical protein
MNVRIYAADGYEKKITLGALKNKADIIIGKIGVTLLAIKTYDRNRNNGR